MSRIFSTADMALAYELRQEGCSWKRIATGLGYDCKTLNSIVKRAERRGLTYRIARDSMQHKSSG